MVKNPDADQSDIRAQRDQLITAVVMHVPFDGWTRAALLRGAEDIGLDKSDAQALYPGDARDMIAWHSQMADRRMMAALEKADLDSLKIRERIATAVMTRLEQNAQDREAIRRGLAILSKPQNAGLALQLLYRTVDDMWFAAGDRSTDWNFYSKRMLLSGVYSSTLMVWLNDQTEDFSETRAFLDRRIENVMQIPKLKSRVSAVAQRLPLNVPGRMAARMKAFRSFGRGGMRGTW